ncbi:MAG: hypothetical protein QM784_05135 [Polyangiaceae bacterium]
MPSLRSLTVQLKKVALACATLLLVLLGVASGARTDPAQGFTVQVLRQTMGHRLQQNLRRPVLLNSRGITWDGVRSGDDETSTDRGVFSGLPVDTSFALVGIVISGAFVSTHGQTSHVDPAQTLIRVPEARAPPLPLVRS